MSDRWTTGLCDIIDNNRDQRCAFFEIDTKAPEIINLIRYAYEQWSLDVLIHPTKIGYHFLSPTVLPLADWKAFHLPLRAINNKCPMVCMRVEPNKYPNEDAIWYHSEQNDYRDSNKYRNSRLMCNYFNRIWRTNFIGEFEGNIKIVRYKLPEPTKMIVK